MKSGNVIHLPLVKTWKVETRGDEVISLKIERYKFARFFNFQRLIVSSINLSQIEAITEF